MRGAAFRTTLQPFLERPRPATARPDRPATAREDPAMPPLPAVAPVLAAPATAFSAASSGTAPDAAAVAAFLRDHPDFLAEHPDLYLHLAPPRRLHGERVADHMAAMLDRERGRNRGLEAEMALALATGRATAGLSRRVRLAVLALMRAPDVVEAVTQELPALLGLETCTLLAEAPDRRGVLPLPPGAVQRLLGHGREALVRPRPTDRALLHVEAGDLIGRDALVRVPVCPGGPTLLALGARDAATLPLRQAVPTLTFLGRTVAAALAR